MFFIDNLNQFLCYSKMAVLKIFVPIWCFLILLETQEIQSLKNCWTWALGESSDYNNNSSSNVIKLFNTDQNSNQYFGMGCYTSNSAGKNCVLKHQKSLYFKVRI